MDATKLRTAEVPAILIHNLALSVMLTRSDATARRLARLLDQVPVEENQEDILCAISIRDDPSVSDSILAFLRKAVASKVDSAVRTGLLVLTYRHTREEFEAHFASLLASVENPNRRAELAELAANEFQAVREVGPAWIKVWDDFSMDIYDDGLVMRHGRAFRSFKPR